jgi:hypothetical protein
LETKNKEIEDLKQLLKNKDDEIKKLTQIINKRSGHASLIEGKKYESKIYEICNKCYINDKKFNTQKENELGGNSCNNDIECNYIK